MQENKREQPNEAESQDQNLYDIFVSQGIKIASQLKDKLNGKASVDIIGNTLFTIVNKIEAEGAKNGIEFPIHIIMKGFTDLVPFVIKISGVKISEDQIKAVVGISVGKWLQNALNTGKITKEQIAEYSKQAQQLQQQGNQGQGIQQEPGMQQQQQSPAQQPQAQQSGLLNPQQGV